MKKNDIVRAWKDAKYRRSLSAAQLAALPAHPAAVMAIDDDELAAVAGGASHTSCCTCQASICTPCPPAQCF